jgi:AbiV family abortive infection protein
MSGAQEEEISAEFARHWWKQLMANAVALVEDAALLASNQSPGRAQSLVVLAMEELAKARWIYEAAQRDWNAEKLQVAEQFASGLRGFWDPDRRIEYYELPDLASFEATAWQRNLDKQAGFYVDRSANLVSSPLHVSADGVADVIRRAAKVIQMHLIEDHTRQQDAPDAGLIDSAEDLHWAVMPYSDPELYADFMERASGTDGPRSR